MNIETGDIFELSTQVYLLVINSQGDSPSTVECVLAVGSPHYVVDDQADLEAAGLVFRNWEDVGLDWVWIDAPNHSSVSTDVLAKLERVAQDRSVGTIQAIYAQVKRGRSSARQIRDRALRASLQAARTVMPG